MLDTTPPDARVNPTLAPGGNTVRQLASRVPANQAERTLFSPGMTIAI